MALEQTPSKPLSDHPPRSGWNHRVVLAAQHSMKWRGKDPGEDMARQPDRVQGDSGFQTAGTSLGRLHRMQIRLRSTVRPYLFLFNQGTKLYALLPRRIQL